MTLHVTLIYYISFILYRQWTDALATRGVSKTTLAREQAITHVPVDDSLLYPERRKVIRVCMYATPPKLPNGPNHYMMTPTRAQRSKTPTLRDNRRVNRVSTASELSDWLLATRDPSQLWCYHWQGLSNELGVLGHKCIMSEEYRVERTDCAT